jgi:hypothetical protein
MDMKQLLPRFRYCFLPVTDTYLLADSMVLGSQRTRSVPQLLQKTLAL